MHFDKAFEKLIGHEGDFSDNPADPGGATRYGVTERVARAHGYTGDMRDLPIEFAKAVIYRPHYWDEVRADDMPDALRFHLFDAAVNSGPEQAVMWLQRAVGVTADGLIGPKTIAAIRATDPRALVARYCGIRLRFMTNLPTWPSFGRGWARRIADNLMEA